MEHNDHKTNSETLRNKIMTQIKAERIAMRPRVYFTLQLAAVAFVSLLVLMVTIFLFNFILFSIRINSHEAFLSFGPRGIVAFLIFFPWPFLIFDVLLIAALEWLLRTFKFGYRMPMLYLLAAILSITFLSGFALDRGTRLNDRLMIRADGPGLPPPIGIFYRSSQRAPHDGACRCVITGIDGNILTVSTLAPEASSTLTIILPENDPRATTTELSVGDTVFIAGDREGDTIRAFGLRKIDPNAKLRLIIKDKIEARPE